jgi:hypothetical protein
MNLDSLLLRFTDSILKHPLSAPFRAPVDIDKSAIEHYRACCPDPMDLSTVNKKLKSQQYPSLKTWWADMNLIFDNAIRYNSAGSVIGGMAQYLKRQVEKKIQTLLCNNPRNYEARLFELTKTIRDLLDEPPGTLHLTPVPTETFPLLEDFTADRIEALLAKLNAEVRAGKLADIEAVLEKCGERMPSRESPELDLAGISRRGLHALEQYVSEHEF